MWWLNSPNPGKRLFEKGSAIVRRQGATKIRNFALIILLHRYSLRLSLAFQTISKGRQDLTPPHKTSDQGQAKGNSCGNLLILSRNTANRVPSF
jgi:hypothetical protein